MTLAMVIESAEEFQKLDESIQKLYKADDSGKYSLDVTGHVNTDDKGGARIPIERLNAEIEKRKESETAMKELADQAVETVPEDKRSIIPDLKPAAKIKWIQNAHKLDFFSTGKPPVDPKKPGDQKPKDFENMSPQAIMAQGYKNK